MPAGRPTDYNEEVQKKATDYLFRYEEIGDVIPSVEGLSIFLQVARKTIYNWAKDENKTEFLHTLDQINVVQKKVLLEKGLKGDFNSNITKLALGNHGMSEKIHNEMSAPGGGPIQTTTVINFVPVSRKKGE
jgi:hypothetical protein